MGNGPSPKKQAKHKNKIKEVERRLDVI